MDEVKLDIMINIPQSVHNLLMYLVDRDNGSMEGAWFDIAGSLIAGDPELSAELDLDQGKTSKVGEIILDVINDYIERFKDGEPPNRS